MARERPFDARFSLISDRGDPAPQWRTVSLVLALREFIRRDPAAVISCMQEHHALLVTCVDELTARGIDANSLVRFGMLPELVGGILGPYLFTKVPDADDLDGMIPGEAVGWHALLDDRCRVAGVLDEEGRVRCTIESPDFERTLTALITVVVEYLDPWIRCASVADLLSLRAPTAEWLESKAPGAPPEIEIIEAYRWMVERFSVTALEEWSTESLHREYKYVEGAIAPPCPLGLMDDRAVDAGALRGEIARRAVQPAPAQEYPQVRASLAARMTAQATALLHAEQFGAACALFEFALAENADDPAARNNLGFCLIPTDPQRAAEHLKEAARLGYRPVAVNTYNQMVAAYLVSGPAAALTIAEDEWERVSESGTASCTLWVLSEEAKLALAERVDALSAIASLAAHAADLGGHTERAEVWRHRAA